MILSSTPPFGADDSPWEGRRLACILKNTHTTVSVVVVGNVYHSVWSLGEGVLAEYFHESNLCLEHSKPHANTVAWAPAKRHVCQLWSVLPSLSCEPVFVSIRSLRVLLMQERHNTVCTNWESRGWCFRWASFGATWLLITLFNHHHSFVNGNK